MAGYDENLVKITIGENLKKLQKAIDWTQNKFAAETDIAVGSLNGYMKGVTAPPATYLARLCAMSEFKKFELTLDTFLDGDFDPENVVRQKPGNVTKSKEYELHKDYVGTYLTYIFNQTKIEHGKVDEIRELRYGVINIYEKRNPIGDNTYHALARFYKESKKDEAFGLKRKVDEILSAKTPSADDYERAHKLILADNEYYTGALTFSENHTFLSLESSEYSDHALIILHAPPKKKGNRLYIGGLGSVCSVSRSRNHMPAAQKIIISRYQLEKSREEIGAYLFMYSSNLSTTDEVTELVRLFKRLYATGADADRASEYLLEIDKAAIFENRLNQIIREYIEKTACCVSTVSEEEDSRVYALIKSFRPNTSDAEAADSR